jgi:hypothetical protein
MQVPGYFIGAQPVEYVVPLAAPSPASDYVAAPDAGFVLVPNGGMTPGGFPPEMLGYPQPYVYPDPNVAFYEPYYQPPKPASKPSPCFNRTQKLVYILDVLALLTAISVLITLLVVIWTTNYTASCCVVDDNSVCGTESFNNQDTYVSGGICYSTASDFPGSACATAQLALNSTCGDNAEWVEECTSDGGLRRNGTIFFGISLLLNLIVLVLMIRGSFWELLIGFIFMGIEFTMTIIFFSIENGVFYGALGNSKLISICSAQASRKLYYFTGHDAIDILAFVFWGLTFVDLGLIAADLILRFIGWKKSGLPIKQYFKLQWKDLKGI